MLVFYLILSAPRPSRVSDQELVAQVADTTRELGIEIDLSYSFLQGDKDDPEDK